MYVNYIFIYLFTDLARHTDQLTWFKIISPQFTDLS